ncbi:MAG: CDP-alcohol phosphatidyltransferase family protein [Chloroflexi bacterium]|nr:CDP-alcohol phosphatidyltransferase family protein [Chloroflexota bacterium]
MITSSIRSSARRFAEALARGLAKTGMTPNILTIIALLLNGVAAAVVAVGYLSMGGILVMLFGAFDTLDGALARVTGKSSKFGAFLDSTLDRYSEAFVFFGLLVLFSVRGDVQATLLVYAVLVGSLMVSYTRARAEGLGLDCEVGLLPRPERIILLGLGLILNQVVIALWILAILTNVTAVQRILHVWKLTSTTNSRSHEHSDAKG